MRNYDTPVRAIRHKVFAEVAKAGFESSDETLIHDIEAIPYNIVEEKAKYRESIYRERAVASERVRLAMGLSLRPENKAVHLTDGLAASNINEKYYEPPLMQVIPSACAACPWLCDSSMYAGLSKRCDFHERRKILYRSGKMYQMRQMQGSLSIRCHLTQRTSMRAGMWSQSDWK